MNNNFIQKHDKKHTATHLQLTASHQRHSNQHSKQKQLPQMIVSTGLPYFPRSGPLKWKKEVEIKLNLNEIYHEFPLLNSDGIYAKNQKITLFSEALLNNDFIELNDKIICKAYIHNTTNRNIPNDIINEIFKYLHCCSTKCIKCNGEGILNVVRQICYMTVQTQTKCDECNGNGYDPWIMVYYNYISYRKQKIGTFMN
eukprot:246953_1